MAGIGRVQIKHVQPVRDAQIDRLPHLVGQLLHVGINGLAETHGGSEGMRQFQNPITQMILARAFALIYIAQRLEGGEDVADIALVQSQSFADLRHAQLWFLNEAIQHIQRLCQRLDLHIGLVQSCSLPQNLIL